MKKNFNNRVVYYNKKEEIHREDGLPAVEYNNGDRTWYINGRKHRTDGPAVEWINGYKSWYINGKRHREDGPAIEHSDGDKSWYLNDIKYTEEEFNQEIIKLKLKRLINL